ncbi:unnamed protein product [Tilletia caries]|nr:unnamed protein product [Tilletia caries]
MSSFYPADFAHSAPGSASGSTNSAYPPRAGAQEGSRPYTMASYLGPSGGGGEGPAGAGSGNTSGPSSSSYHGSGSEYVSGGPSYQSAAGPGNGSSAAVLAGYRPATSHETFSGANYSYPSSRSSFSAYGSAPVTGTYGSSGVPSSSSTAAPYHHGGYPHPAGYGAPAGPGGSGPSGIPSEGYPSYPPQTSNTSSDPSAT